MLLIKLMLSEQDSAVKEARGYMYICSDKELFVNLENPRNSRFTYTIIK